MSAAMGLLSWGQSGQLGLIGLNANRFLGMMSRLAVGWLLLEAAVVALGAQAKLPASDPDKAFYEGKKQAALWFARNELPKVEAEAKLMMQQDASAMDIPRERSRGPPPGGSPPPGATSAAPRARRWPAGRGLPLWPSP